MADTTLDKVALAAFRSRITKILPTQIRSCIADLTRSEEPRLNSSH